MDKVPMAPLALQVVVVARAALLPVMVLAQVMPAAHCQSLLPVVQFVLSGDRVEHSHLHSLQINNKKCQKQILQAHFEVTNTEAEDLLACGRLVLHPLTP